MRAAERPGPTFPSPRLSAITHLRLRSRRVCYTYIKKKSDTPGEKNFSATRNYCTGSKVVCGNINSMVLLILTLPCQYYI